MKKFFCFCLCSVICFLTFGSNSFALEVNSTFADVSSTSSYAVNLINYANSYDSFIDSDFVVFHDLQDSYYIVWGDLEVESVNEIKRVFNVGSDAVEYIRYYRTSNIGGSNNYRYMYGVDDNFSLSSEHINTSNLKEYGFTSSTFNTYFSYYQIWMFLILIGSFLFAIMFLNLRRSL